MEFQIPRPFVDSAPTISESVRGLPTSRSIRAATLAFVVTLIVGDLATIGPLARSSFENRALIERLTRDDAELETRVVLLGGLLEDGLDDGLTEAAEQARDVAEARRIASDIGRAEIVAASNETARRLEAEASAFVARIRA